MAFVEVLAGCIEGSLVRTCVWLLSLVAITFAWALWRYRDHALFTQPIPSSVAILPGGKPLIGHAVDLLGNLQHIHHWLLESSRKMGFRTYAFSLPTLHTFYMVTDPKCLEYILKTNNDSFVKGQVFLKNFGCLLGHGIFTTDGEQWLWQRKLATNIFSVKSFKRYMNDVFAAKLGLVVEKLALCRTSSTPVDLHELMYSFTLDSFGQIGFGVNPGCLTSDAKVPFAAAFDRAQVIINERFWMPAWPLVELINGDAFRMAADIRVIKDFAIDIINKRREQLAAGSTADKCGDPDAVDAAPKDLLSLFMEVQGPDGKPLDNKQLVDTVLNFIIAGRDTTAQALSWTFYQLMRHPQCEAKLMAELHDVLRAGHPAHPSYEQIRQLKYTKACFLEALRLNPSVPEDVRYADREHVLPDKSVIPKNGQVVYSAYVVNRLPAFWGEDAEDFRPERWLEMDNMPTPYNYLTFNAGPRLCVGQRLAELEGVYVLAGLLSRFRFRQTTPGQHVDYRVASTMPMKEGLHVYVQDRV